jgi:hypothetical protein
MVEQNNTPCANRLPTEPHRPPVTPTDRYLGEAEAVAEDRPFEEEHRSAAAAESFPVAADAARSAAGAAAVAAGASASARAARRRAVCHAVVDQVVGGGDAVAGGWAGAVIHAAVRADTRGAACVGAVPGGSSRVTR